MEQYVLRTDSVLKCSVPHFYNLTSFLGVFFSSIRWLEGMWSVVDLLSGNPHWEFPLILSMYGVDLERRMLNREFYM
jgi:hypothetical protein